MVVAAGETATDPLSGTRPISGSIAVCAASVEAQLSVADSPALMLEGDAFKLTVGAGAITVTLAVRVVVPPGPEAVKV